MDALILLRHGKAVREHEAESDAARGLSERGWREAAKAGEEIAAAGLEADVVLVSTAQRTRETYAALAETIAMPKARFSPGLYMASAERIWNEAAASGGACVLVIGHNPGLQILAAELAAQARDRSRAGRDLADHLPTSAFAAFSLAGATLEAAGPRLIAHWSPKS
ncbi:MAG: histidine phosphatase family protein [Hyphomonadaceae bacterium]